MHLLVERHVSMGIIVSINRKCVFENYYQHLTT
uniref:Uncharacterized protein n=1 Tax=Arundo donax TaxID=35708 RepID=A0A0A9QR59_ARUDO